MTKLARKVWIGSIVETRRRTRNAGSDAEAMISGRQFLIRSCVRFFKARSVRLGLATGKVSMIRDSRAGLASRRSNKFCSKTVTP